MGGINENSINDLSLTLQLPRNIQISPEESSEHSLSFYTPKLLWALRDFTLDIQDQKGKPITANQYLESALSDHVCPFLVIIINCQLERLCKEQ